MLEAVVFVDIAVFQEDLRAILAQVVLLKLLVEFLVVIQDLIDVSGGMLVIK